MSKDSGAIDENGSANQEEKDVNEDSDLESNTDEDSKDKETVPKSAYANVTKDLHKWKARAKENERLLSEVNEKLTALQAKSEDGNDFKAQAERYKREAETAKTKLAETQNGLVYSAKHNSVLVELKKLGLKDEAEYILEYEDFKDLEVETTSKGRINVLGAKEWADDFYSRKKLFFEPKKSPKVNSTDGRGGTSANGEITPAMLVEAERKSIRTKKPEDKRAFEDLVTSYKKQKQRRA